MTQALQNQIDRLYRRILMHVAPAKILATDDTGPIHRAQVNLNGGPEIVDQLAVMQHYGLSTHAPVGSDATAMFIAGQRSNPVIVATNNQKARLRNLQPGEVALYDNNGTVIKLAAGGNGKGNVEITCTGTVTITAPSVALAASDGGNTTITVTGDLKISGEITAGSGGAGSVTLQQHTHGGVAGGTGHSAKPDAGT